MFCGWRETARHGYSLRHRGVPAQFIFAGMADLSTSDKMWLLKVLELNGDNGIMKGFGIGIPNRFRCLGNRLSFHVEITYTEQSYVPVRLDSCRLVKFRTYRKIKVDDVALTQLVSRIPSL